MPRASVRDGAGTYMPYGEIKTVTDPDGYVTTYGYDTAHRLTDIFDAQNNDLHYTLNASGQKTGEQVLNASGTVLRSATKSYNGLGQLASIVDGLNQTVFSATFSDSYDANGNLVHSADGLNYQQQQSFDALNRLSKTIANYNGSDTATANTTTSTSRDALDRVTGVMDPSNLTTTTTFDGLSNATGLQSPDIGSSTDSYDAAGNRIVHTDAKGFSGVSTYDALDRLTATTYADTTQNVSYAYDESNSITGCTTSSSIGRLTRVIENTFTTAYCYDVRGNVIQKMYEVSSGATDVTRYVYTPGDRLGGYSTPDFTNIKSPNQSMVHYNFDTNGRINKVTVIPADATTPATSPTNPAVVVSSVTWMPFGPVAKYTLGNGQVVTRSYDANYRLTDLVSPALTLHFKRDVMGNIQGMGNAAGANPATESYGYDPLYRLTSVTDAGTAIASFTYNQTGDRLSKTGSGAATGLYTYTPNTHLLTGMGTAAYANDADGNTTGSVIGGNSYGFGYNNGRNRLTVSQLNTQTVGTYTYNAWGERVNKAATGMGERFGYDETHRELGEYGVTNRDYVWMGDVLVGLVDNNLTANNGPTSTISYVTVDHLGTPRAVSNAAGTTIWQWAYQGNPFGEQQPTSATGYVLNLRYPGQYFDAETNTNYNMFRTYEPATGRYLQSDPMGLAGGISTYAYGLNNPLQMIDPLGLCSCAGGHWKQEKYDFGVGVAFGGMLSINKAIFHCVSDPRISVEVRQTSIAGGLIAGVGGAWSLSGEAFGVSSSKDFAGWSTNQIFASFGPLSDSAPLGTPGGGSLGGGPSFGGGLAWGSTYTEIIKETCPDCGDKK